MHHSTIWDPMDSQTSEDDWALTQTQESSTPPPSDSPQAKKPWGRFVSLNPDKFPHILLDEEEYVLGRHPNCSGSTF